MWAWLASTTAAGGAGRSGASGAGCSTAWRARDALSTACPAGGPPAPALLAPQLGAPRPAVPPGFTSSCPTPAPWAGTWTPGADGASEGAPTSLRRWWRRPARRRARRCGRPPLTRAWPPSAATPSAARWAGKRGEARWAACQRSACPALPGCLRWPPACLRHRARTLAHSLPLTVASPAGPLCLRRLACSAASACGLPARRRARRSSTAPARGARRQWRWGAAPGSPAGSRRRRWRAP